jgi:hypothetical protein
MPIDAAAKKKIYADKRKTALQVTEDAATQDASAAAVNRWAASAWKAYTPLHAIAREWIAQSLAYRGHAR